nr:UPF0598 protein C8orf82 homolog isoform X2 [Taeniopygia guttata]
MRAGPVLRLCALPGLSYRQGQRPEPGIREYFYYLDLHGQLFLDDAKVKNFTTCFRDAAFLSQFFSRLQRNVSGRFRSRFPFVSRCGRERNFLRCADLPVVFTHLLPGGAEIAFGNAGAALTVPFRPEALAALPENGRLYHPAPARLGGAGLVRSTLAQELSWALVFGHGPAEPPTHFRWRGKEVRLSPEVLVAVREERARMEEGR